MTAPRRLLVSFRENEAGGIDANKLIACRLRWLPNAEPSLQADFFNRRQGGNYVRSRRKTDHQARTTNYRADCDIPDDCGEPPGHRSEPPPDGHLIKHHSKLPAAFKRIFFV